MIRAIRPSAVARDDATLITGWNIAPNLAYTVSLSVSASAVVVLLADADNSGLIGSGLALVGADQPVTIMPMTGQTISMVDADLGWHMLVTASGTEGERTITIDPMVDLADEIHPIYTDDNMALARATAAINAGACYVDDVSVTCPLGLGTGIGGVASAPVDGTAVVGQVESVTWTGSPDGSTTQAVIRRHTAIAPEAYTPPPAPPVLVDDTAETDAATATSGNVLANDTGTLTVVAVNGLRASVGEEVAGSNGGVFVIGSDGAWTFDPDGDFAALSGSDTATTSVSYHASNGQAEASATLTVTVIGVFVQLWTPALIPSATKRWLDLADEETVTVVDGYVSSVLDKSTSQKNAIMNTQANQPMRVLNGVEFVQGRSLNFDLTCLINTSYIVFLVAEPVGNDGYIIGGRAIERGSLLAAIGLNAVYSSHVSSGTDIYVTGVTPTQVQGDAALWAWSYSMAVRNTHRGGNLKGSVTTSKYISSFGGGVLGNCAYGWGEVILREMVVLAGSWQDINQYSRLVEGYLSHKWDLLLGSTALVSDLASDHPYKSAPPVA